MNHIFCIHSSVNGHLGRFHFLDVPDSAELGMVCRLSVVGLPLPFGVSPREIHGH